LRNRSGFCFNPLRAVHKNAQGCSQIALRAVYKKPLRAVHKKPLRAVHKKPLRAVHKKPLRAVV